MYKPLSRAIVASEMDALTDWLASLELKRYAEVFAENDVDFDAVRLLSDGDLEKLGVSLGHRRKLLRAIDALNSRSVTTSAALPIDKEKSPDQSATTAEGERRQLTVLFCDMVGFTELANRVDPEVLQRIIRSYEDACAVCITRYEGYVFQRLGDGIVAFFGYPLAHEGEAERAIHAGLEIIDALSKLDVPEAGHLAGAHRHRHRRGGGVLGRERRGGRDDESGLPAARHRASRAASW